MVSVSSLLKSSRVDELSISPLLKLCRFWHTELNVMNVLMKEITYGILNESSAYALDFAMQSD